MTLQNRLFRDMNLPLLNFPETQFRFKKNEAGKLQIFDGIRKRFIDLTPEEWVRQNLVNFLIRQKGVPASLISIEKQLILNHTKRRTDLVVYDSFLKPVLIVECKSPSISLTQETLNQAIGYNLVLKVPFVLLSNGLSHFCINYSKDQPVILSEIPHFNHIINKNQHTIDF